LAKKKECYCPVHDDKNPSATLYHNQDKTVVIYCSKCGTVKAGYKPIQKPSIPHQDFNYKIAIKNGKVRARLKDALGTPSQIQNGVMIWSYRPKSIDDIYTLFLAKMQILQDGFILCEDTEVTPINYKDINAITNYIANTKPLSSFIKNGDSLSAYSLRHIQTNKYTHKGFIFVEMAIILTYEYFLKLGEFSEICNQGIAFYEYITDTIKKEGHLLQKDRTFKVLLNPKHKKRADEVRLSKRDKTVQSKKEKLQNQIKSKLNQAKYIKPNGKPNITKICNELNIHRDTYYSYKKSER